MSLSRLHIVDDDPTIREIARRVAEAAGFEALGFDAPADFLAAAASDPPELVLLDLAIGEQDGIGVLEALAKLNSRCAIIVLSGLEDRLVGAAVRIGRSLGLQMLEPLAKPFQLHDLRARLSAAAAMVLPIRESDVRDALASHQLVPRYQPKVRLSDGAPVGCEALVRWQHPSRGLLAPSHFLPLVEAGPSITPLTYQMIERAMTDLAAWRQRHPGLSVAVNVSARSLDDAEFADRVWEILARTGADPSSLTLEITETAAMADTAAVAAMLTRLRIRKVNLSLDDFGTGFSSLVELHRMPFSELKVDRAFVGTMETDRDARVIVKAIIGLAHTLGLITVAEGVETEAAMDMLREMGCDVAQGYGIGKPMTAEAFQEWLDARAGIAAPSLAPPPGPRGLAHGSR
ncbi:MAG TPA: EAL domain-containing response regulator [Roseococcus sp.]|nr:EAL domain-containing response regulator [Roseococcus sp.]